MRGAFGVALLCVIPRAAEADGRSAARADALFREAKQLLDRGRVHDACEKFAESHRLDPALGGLLNLADCHAREGRTATAQAEFAEAAKMAAERGKAERERLDFALARVAELEKKLSRVQLVVADDAIAEIELDGRALDRAAWATPIALDPGEHAVIYRVPGKPPHVEALPVAPGPWQRTLTLGEARRDSPAASDGGAQGRRIAGFVLGGVGLAGIGVGAYFGLRAISKKGDGDKRCEGKFCDEQGLALHDDAQRSATVSTIAFIAGAATLGAGVALVVTAWGPKKKDGGIAIGVQPLGVYGGAVRVEGAF